MINFGVILLFTVVSSTVYGNPKVLELNHKFQKENVAKLCQKNEVISECFKKQVRKLHETEKLTVEDLIETLPVGKGVILKEKEWQKKSKAKISNSDLNLISHIKQANFGLFILGLSCTAKTLASAPSYLKTLKALVEEQIELVRKYSDSESVQLQMKFDTTLLCEKKK